MKKIIIATGGSGGHLVPALRVAEVLREGGHDVFFLGVFKDGGEQVQKNGFSFENLQARGLQNKSLVDNASAGISLLRAGFVAHRFLKQYRPDVVCGFGGYGAFPGVLAARCLSLPTLIHEQNVLPGRANAFLAKYVKKIAISFRESKRYFPADKTVLTGCPSHEPTPSLDKATARKELGLQESLKTVFVFGGSQGSEKINTVFVDMLEQFKKNMNVQVIHISGPKNYDKLKVRYKNLGIPFALFPFFDKIELAYTAADLVICRAGALTVTELALFQKPAILIPYPHAKGHQEANALTLCRAEVAKMLRDQYLSAVGLKENMLDVLANFQAPGKFDNLNKDFSLHAAKRLADEIIKLI